MRKLIISTCVILFVGFAITVKAQTSFDDKYDIAELMNTAKQNFDLDKQDAVYLLDSKDVGWLSDGRLSTTIHSIIWLNTEVAVEMYGDHRIPYDSAHETFTVKTLRTWRDNQWWPTGPTGIVETLPYQMRNAYDYSNIREMMLLHNGIEIHCIIEFAYTIEDKEPYRKNFDGVYSLQREQPAVKSILTIEAPENIVPEFYSSLPTQKKIKERNVSLNLDTYTWELGPLDKMPAPRTDESEFSGPYVAWSTWNGWSAIGEFINQTYNPMLQLDSTLNKAVDSLNNKARNKYELADLIAGYVNDQIMLIQYQENFWYSFPRTASRIYETSYANPVDKCILAQAMFKQADLNPEFVFLSKGLAMHDMSTPTLDYFSGIRIYLPGNNCPAYYDPSTGTITRSDASGFGRAYFYTVTDAGKGPVTISGNDLSTLNIKMQISPGDSTYGGNGYCFSWGCFNAFNSITGLENQAKDYVGGLVSSILPGAEYKNFNPAVLNCAQAEFGFEFELKKPEADDLGRMKFSLGEPAGGIIQKLPENVHVYEESRGSWIYLPSAMTQKITFEIDTTGMDLVYIPDDQKIENDLGMFSIQSKQNNGKLELTKELQINSNKIAPEDWPTLREMLLEETGERNNTLIFKDEGSKD